MVCDMGYPAFDLPACRMPELLAVQMKAFRRPARIRTTVLFHNWGILPRCHRPIWRERCTDRQRRRPGYNGPSHDSREIRTGAPSGLEV